MYRKGDGEQEALGVSVSINESAVRESGMSHVSCSKQERAGNCNTALEWDCDCNGAMAKRELADWPISNNEGLSVHTRKKIGHCATVMGW